MVHKILFVIDNLEFGGGERGFLQLIKGLDKNRFDMFVASKPAGEFGEEIKKMGIPLFPVAMKSKYNGLAVANLVHLINKERFHLIHSQGARADFFTRVAVKFSKKPYLVSTLQMPVDGFNVRTHRRILYQFFDRFLERYVDRFIVVSENLENYLMESRQISSKKIIRIYNGIELDAFNPDLKSINFDQLKKTFGIDEGTITVAAIGRLCWQKGFEYFLRAIPKIIENGNKAIFLLVGEGPLRKQLEDLAKFLAIENNVVFTGFRVDIKSILAMVDFLVVPSLLEGFPMIILEAMAMAKPIIASNIDGISEQLENGKTGCLVKSKSPEEISKTLINLMTNREKGNKLGINARKHAIENFSIEKMISKVEQVYMELLSSRNSYKF